MKTKQQTTGKFDLLGKEILNNDLVAIILLDDYLEHGIIGVETLRIRSRRKGGVKMITPCGAIMDLQDHMKVIRLN